MDECKPLPSACLTLAKQLRHDPFTQKALHLELDYVEAAVWLWKSAVGGDAEGQHMLGVCLSLGRAFMVQ